MRKFMILNEHDRYLASISGDIPFYTTDPASAWVCYDERSAKRMIEYGKNQGKIWTIEETNGG